MNNNNIYKQGQDKKYYKLSMDKLELHRLSAWFVNFYFSQNKSCAQVEKFIDDFFFGNILAKESPLLDIPFFLNALIENNVPTSFSSQLTQKDAIKSFFIRKRNILAYYSELLSIAMRSPVPKKILSVNEFAEIIGVSKPTAFSLIKDYKIPHYKLTPKKINIAVSDYNIFLAAKKNNLLATSSEIEGDGYFKENTKQNDSSGNKPNGKNNDLKGKDKDKTPDDTKNNGSKTQTKSPKKGKKHDFNDNKGTNSHNGENNSLNGSNEPFKGIKTTSETGSEKKNRLPKIKPKTVDDISDFFSQEVKHDLDNKASEDAETVSTTLDIQDNAGENKVIENKAESELIKDGVDQNKQTNVSAKENNNSEDEGLIPDDIINLLNAVEPSVVETGSEQETKAEAEQKSELIPTEALKPNTNNNDLPSDDNENDMSGLEEILNTNISDFIANGEELLGSPIPSTLDIKTSEAFNKKTDDSLEPTSTENSDTSNLASQDVKVLISNKVSEVLASSPKQTPSFNYQPLSEEEINESRRKLETNASETNSAFFDKIKSEGEKRHPILILKK